MAIVSGTTLLLSLVFQAKLGHTNPYMGMFIYMVLPPFVFLGLVLVPIGMFRRWRHIKKYGDTEVPKWPYIDLNKGTHRNITVLFFFGSLAFATIMVFGGYQAFHYSESITFCGTTCHTVMKPEHEAYQNSAHARVRCTACHVGEGADWYAKSKLAGAYQVYAVTTNVFPRPIPTPIENLRPAQETCEQCHWPEKFYGGQQRQFNHYMYDEENTHWPINVLIKTGGGDPKTGQTAGIHWHMNIGVKTEYIARDERRQDIPWIKVTDSRTGRETVYQDNDNPLTEEEIATLEKRKMDCMDCHNRPSHKFHSPDYMIDAAVLTGMIDKDLPEIKRFAVEAMAGEYATEDEAIRGIASRILKSYRDEYPEVFEERRVAIDKAIISTQEQFTKSIFPEMKVRWEHYLDNIGHFIYPGCMRCHAGNKISEEGFEITRDCTACHAILSQGSGERAQMATTADGLEFVHPEDIDEEWRETGCFECHTGIQP
jgi:hypothetical protein